MNKLLTPNGGFPLHGDDFGFIDAAVRDGMKGLLYDLVEPFDGNLILGGCVFAKGSVGSNATVTEGYIMLDYEVLYVPAQSMSVFVGSTFSLYLSSTTSQPRVFANGASQNVWQTRTAQMTYTVGGGATGLALGPATPRLSDGLEALLLGTYKFDTSITVSNSWTKSSFVVPQLDRLMRNVTLSGQFIPGTISNTSYTHMCTLPVDFRPTRPLTVVVAAATLSTYGFCTVRVEPSGQVLIINNSTTVWDVVFTDFSFVI